jgi:hypothetical protein
VIRWPPVLSRSHDWFSRSLHPLPQTPSAMVSFGDFKPLCEQTPSYPWCNLFYRQVLSRPESRRTSSSCNPSLSQLLKSSPKTLTGLSSNAATAPVGINPECGALKAGEEGSLGNIANMIVCGVSMIVVAALITITTRRRAAVGASLSILRTRQLLEDLTRPASHRSLGIPHFPALVLDLSAVSARHNRRRPDPRIISTCSLDRYPCRHRSGTVLDVAGQRYSFHTSRRRWHP